ncbi:MAG: flagellar protein [Firmicutes bacterium]|nr:flagellar protein [Bacillota bacterium]
MVDKVYFPQPIVPVKQPTDSGIGKPNIAHQSNPSFQEILERQLYSNLKFSQHAQQRLNARQIQLGTEELEQLSAAVEKAAQKGARDSLIVMNNLAFIVSVKNKTVITAVDEANLKENVFTNIDSAVII